jgi:hypothetical protein
MVLLLALVMIQAMSPDPESSLVTQFRLVTA